MGLKNYLVAITLAIILFSIAGVPPLAGFFSKFFVLLSAISNEYYFLSFFIVFLSLRSFFFNYFSVGFC